MDPSLRGTGVTLLNLKSSGSDLISEMGSDCVGEEEERVRGEERGLGEGEREDEISVSECWVNRRFFNGVVDSFTRRSSGLFSRFSLQHTTRSNECRKLQTIFKWSLICHISRDTLYIIIKMQI